MNEQPTPSFLARSSAMRAHLPLILLLLRLGAAFLCGWVLVWLAVHLLPFAYFPLSLALPLLLGISAGASVGRRSKYPVTLAVFTGVLVLAGIATALLPLAIQADMIARHAPCELGVYVCSEELVGATRAVVGYLLYSLLLVLLGSSVTSRLISQRRKDRQNP